MKKIALATLLAATTMVASAQVSISGKVAQFIDNTKTGAVSNSSMAGEPTNNIAFSATENLGSGLKARVVVETSLGTNSINGGTTQLGDRQSTVGLTSNVGTLDFGRNVHSEFLAITNNDVFGTMYGSIAGDVHNLRGLRLSNGVFATVNPVKGVTVSFDRSQGTTGIDATSYGATGKFAGFTATAARFEQGAETSTVVGLNTKIGGTTITYTHSDDNGVVKSTGNLIGLSQAIGAYTAKASYGTTDKNVKAYAVGIDYAFSKRTDAVIAYRNVNYSGIARDVEQVGVGLIHRF